MEWVVESAEVVRKVESSAGNAWREEETVVAR
jgi:hypothetical protein